MPDWRQWPSGTWLWLGDVRCRTAAALGVLTPHARLGGLSNIGPTTLVFAGSPRQWPTALYSSSRLVGIANVAPPVQVDPDAEVRCLWPDR